MKEAKCKTFVIIGLLLFLIISTCIQRYQITDLQEGINGLTEELRIEKEFTHKMGNELLKLRVEFDTYKRLSSNEFESTWKSFARVRNNFLAIGHGYHLKPEDFPPQMRHMMAKD